MIFVTCSIKPVAVVVAVAALQFQIDDTESISMEKTQESFKQPVAAINTYIVRSVFFSILFHCAELMYGS